MNDSPFVIERVMNATIQKVWAAITEREQMKQWYFDLEKFEPKIGFKFSFVGGPPDVQYVHLCRVTQVVEFQKIAYTWAYQGYDGESEVIFELFPDGAKTKVRLTHRGLHTFPPIKDFARTNFEAGWTDLIGQLLKDFVEK